MSVYARTPFTITGQNDIPSEAPRSQGMDDTAAEAIVAANDDLMSQVLHLHLDLVGNTVTVGLDNAVDGVEFYVDFGDGNGQTLFAPDTCTHDYYDGVYTVVAYSREGAPEAAQQEIAVNWPPPSPVPPDPEP